MERTRSERGNEYKSIRGRMKPRGVRWELGTVRREKKEAEISKSGRSTTFVYFELCVIIHS